MLFDIIDSWKYIEFCLMSRKGNMQRWLGINHIIHMMMMCIEATLDGHKSMNTRDALCFNQTRSGVAWREKMYSERFFPRFLVRADASSVDLLLYVSGKCWEQSCTLWGWGGLHLSSSKSHQLSMTDFPLSTVDWQEGWLISDELITKTPYW